MKKVYISFLILFAVLCLQDLKAVVAICSNCEVTLEIQNKNASYTFAANKTTCIYGNTTLSGDVVFGENATVCIKEGAVLNLSGNNFSFNSSSFVNFEVFGTLNLTQNHKWSGDMNITIHETGVLQSSNAITFDGNEVYINNNGNLSVGTLEFQKSGSKVVISNYNNMEVSNTINISEGNISFLNSGNFIVKQNFNSNSTSIYINCGTFTGRFNLNNGGKVINNGTFNSSQIDFGGSKSRIENYGRFNFDGSTINPSGGTIYNEGIFKLNSGNISGDCDLVGPSNSTKTGHFIWSDKAVINKGKIGPNLNFYNPKGESSKDKMFNSPGSLDSDERGHGNSWGNSEPITLSENDCQDHSGNPTVPSPTSYTACKGVDLTGLQPNFGNVTYEWWTGSNSSRDEQITTTSSPKVTNYTSEETVYLWAKNSASGVYSASGSGVTIKNCTPVTTSLSKTGIKDKEFSFSVNDFTSNFSDPDNQALTKITIISLPSKGKLKLNGSNIKEGDEISDADLANITYTPINNWTGSTKFIWNGSNGTSYASENAEVEIKIEEDITIEEENDYNTVSEITKTGTVNTDITFTSNDFTSKFEDDNDDDDENSLTKIKVIDLPVNGTLKLNGTPIIAGQEILASELAKITFTPNTDWTGNTAFIWKGFDGTSYASSNSIVNIIITNNNNNIALPAATCSGPFLSSVQALNPSDVPANFYKPYSLNTFLGRDNAISLSVGGNLTIESKAAELEGRTMVLGNLTMNKKGGVFNLGVSGAGSRIVPANGENIFVVGGDLNAASGSADFILGGETSGQQSYGTFVYKGSKSDNFKFASWTDNTKIVNNPNLDITTADSEFNKLITKSNYWKTLSDDGVTFSSGWGTYTFTCTTPVDNKLYVINVPSNFNTVSYQGSINFNGFPDNSTLLINVTGTSSDFNIGSIYIDGNAMAAGSSATDQVDPFALRILWNFADAETVKLGGGCQFWGSVVVPKRNSNVTSTMPGLNGRYAFGGNFTFGGNGAEVHNYPFNGGDLLPCSAPPVVSIISKSGEENKNITFTASDFTSNFTSNAGTLTKIKIADLPANGILKLNGTAIIAGQEIPAGELGNISFTPDANWDGTTSFNWNGFDGTSYATSSAAISLTITAVVVPAQQLTLDGESGNRAIEQANCWGFGAIGYTNTANLIISGSWSMRGNSMTNTALGSCWIKSPWMKVGEGNITISTRMENTTGTTKQLVACYIPYDASAGQYREGTLTPFYTFDYPKSGNNFLTTVNDLTIPLPQEITNSTAFYKIQLSFVGTGGNNRAISDNLVIPGTYWSDPSNNCMPLMTTSAPVAANDSATTTEDNPITINVLSNDSVAGSTINVASVDLDPATAGLQNTFAIAGQGTFTVDTLGVVTFIPEANWSGTTTPLNYTVNENTGVTSNTATITVTVTAVNDVPTVSEITKTGTEDTEISFTSIDFTSKFIDIDGNSITNIKVIDLPANGILKLNGTAITAGQEIPAGELANISFTPDANWDGTTTFNWNGFDGTSYATSSAAINLIVTASNDLPTVSEITKTGTEDSDITFTTDDFTAKFIDIENNLLTNIKVIDLSANGTLKLNGTAITAGQEIPAGELANISFAPDANWVGTTSFNWNGFDGTSYAASSAAISITVTPVNDAPEVTEISKTGLEDNIIIFTVDDFTSKFSDIDGDSFVKIKIVNLPSNGILKLNGDTILTGQEIAVTELANISYKPRNNWNGTITFNWNGFDGNNYAANDAVVNIIISPVNDSPIAVNDINSTFVNKSVNGRVLTNDKEPDHTKLSVTPQTLTTTKGGSVILRANGSYTYTPASGFTGEDRFTYSVCDNESIPLCAQASVTIEVIPKPTASNDAPLAIYDAYVGIINHEVKGKLLNNDFDMDGDALIIESAKYDSNGDGIADASLNLANSTTVWGADLTGLAFEAGSLTLNANGHFTFVPNTGIEGIITFSYLLSDGKGKTDNAIATIHIFNGNSTYAIDDMYFGYKDNDVSGNLLANDFDPEGDVQNIITAPVANPEHGTVMLFEDGSFIYTPNPGYVGTDMFVYEIYDTENPPSRDSATVYFNIASSFITLTLKARLQGAAVDVNNTSIYTPLMRDDLRLKGLIPVSSPYISFTNSILDPVNVLSNKAENSIVDWVYIEVRSALKPATVITSTPGLIQRDGDIVDVDGVSPLKVGGLDTIASGKAYIAVRHRNHLGVMTGLPVDITNSVVYDFTTSALYVQTGIKENPSFVYNGVKMLWGGDSKSIGQIRYTGTNNGAQPIYTSVLNNIGNILKGNSFSIKNLYNNSDCNMDGNIRYTSAGNDTNLIYTNILKNSKGNILKGSGYTAFYDNLP